MKSFNICLTLLIFCFACNNQKQDENAKRENEILQAEKEFSESAMRKGIPFAFAEFAADDAVILRSDSIISGKEAIKNYYNEKYAGKSKVQLTWKPDFVNVAASGDLGYTYGKYKYEITDTLGSVKIYTGTFHTVWRRQKNGEWKYVWD